MGRQRDAVGRYVRNCVQIGEFIGAERRKKHTNRHLRDGAPIPLHVVTGLAALIGPDHLQPFIPAHTPMADSGREDEHVARLTRSRPPRPDAT
jgi:hypothetical protein